MVKFQVILVVVGKKVSVEIGNKFTDWIVEQTPTLAHPCISTFQIRQKRNHFSTIRYGKSTQPSLKNARQMDLKTRIEEVPLE